MLAILKKLSIRVAVPKLTGRIYHSPNTCIKLFVEKDISRFGTILFIKGVFQIVNLSLLLFVLAMQPLTELLHNQLETLSIENSNHSMALKLFARDNESLGKLLSKTKEFLVEVKFSLNCQKSTSLNNFKEVKTLMSSR